MINPIKLLSCLLLCSALFSCGIEKKETEATGSYFINKGLKMYYEIHGNGEPLIIIHGNGGGLTAMKNQIDYFKQNYQVVVMDCRGRGRSELGRDSLTYEVLADDISNLLDYLKLDSAFVLGYSDGGIVGLLLVMNHPEKVKKMAIFGTNIQPDSTALHSESIKHVHKKRLEAEAMIAKGDVTENWIIERQRYRLMEFQPNIKPESLNGIKSPVLVMSCEGDDIKQEHTRLIHQNIPGSQLIIFPGEDHKMIFSNPKLFNSTVTGFFEKQ